MFGEISLKMNSLEISSGFYLATQLLLGNEISFSVANDNLMDIEEFENKQEEPEESLMEEAAEGEMEEFNDQPARNELEEEIKN